MKRVLLFTLIACSSLQILGAGKAPSPTSVVFLSDDHGLLDSSPYRVIEVCAQSRAERAERARKL